MKKNWSDSIVTEIPHPIIATINHVIDFVASLVEEPLTLNSEPSIDRNEYYGVHNILYQQIWPVVAPEGMEIIFP